MAQAKKYESNAERQQAYRDRNRKAMKLSPRQAECIAALKRGDTNACWMTDNRVLRSLEKLGLIVHKGWRRYELAQSAMEL